LADTAGIRAQSGQVEQIGVARALEAAAQAQLILLVVDHSGTHQDLDEVLAHWKALGAPVGKTVGILTKADLGGNPGQPWMRFGLERWFETSALTGRGVEEAAQGIADFCEHWVGRRPGEVLLTRLDQVQAIDRALEALTRAGRTTGTELLAGDLRHALRALAGLIGETPPDEILGRIFSTFCIGK
jgi:tRNA modification GTPase